MILLLCLLVFKKINAECRETKGERERERNCVLVCAFQGGISSRKSKKAWLIWLGLLFLAYRDYVITWKIKNFEIQISQSPLTLVIRDVGRRTQSTCGGGGGASSHLWCPNRHSLSSSYFLFFFFFLFRTNKKQIKSTFTLKLFNNFLLVWFPNSMKRTFPNRYHT